jgi:hypothetical protein
VTFRALLAGIVAAGVVAAVILTVVLTELGSRPFPAPFLPF